MGLKERDFQDLREQSKHLLYEIQMLMYLEGYLESGEVDKAVVGLPLDGMPVRNAVIESFVIHARQLIEFLIDTPRQNDATAGVFTHANWDLPPERRALQQLENRFSERVAHLSWKRSEFTANEQLVFASQIVDKLRPVLFRFLEQVDEKKVCDGFVQDARSALAVDMPEDADSEMLDLLESTTRVATTQPPGTTRGTATTPFRQPE